MFKYAKVENEETKLCSIINGNASAEFLQANGYSKQDVKQSDIDNNWYLTPYCKMKTDEQKAKEEQERIAKLHLTKREVFLGLYNARKVTPDQIKAQITDPAALIEFEYATEYFRGNPLIDMVGAALEITPKQLDDFFETNDYTKLLPEEPLSADTINSDANISKEVSEQENV